MHKLHFFGLIFAALLVSIEGKGVPAGEGKLTILSLSDERLEILYYKSAQEGIHVISEVQNDYETVHLSITSMANNEVIFSVDRPSFASAVWSFNGNEFLLVNETQPDSSFKLTSYLVPHEYSHALKNTVNKKKQLRTSLLNHLDHEGVNETGRNQIEEFLIMPEVSLLIEAAKALGENRIQGDTNKPAMIFYTAVLRFSKLSLELNEDGSGDETMVDNPFPTARRRQKRWWWSYCSNSGYYCINCPIGSNCLGLCGRGCSCWWFVCGHCCFAPGCYAHDLICSGGHYTPECILTAPIAIVCVPFLG